MEKQIVLFMSAAFILSFFGIWLMMVVCVALMHRLARKIIVAMEASEQKLTESVAAGQKLMLDMASDRELIQDKFANIIEGQRLGQTEVLKKLDCVIEGQRLSAVLKLEPASLKIKPEDFEANKPVLKTKLLKCLDSERSPDADTKAFCILNHSGWDAFVESETRRNAQVALSRLIANEDKAAAVWFLEELVDKL